MDHIAKAAADFGRHSAGGGGWALGLAVAACVQPGTGNGDPLARSRGDRRGLKVSAREFADASGTSDARVRRHLEAWQRAADAGVVEQPSELSPKDWDDIEHLPTGEWDWAEYYDASKSGGRPRASQEEVAARAARDSQYAQELSDKLVKANPKAMANALRDAEEVQTLARATSEAAQNRRVRRTRERLAEGGGKTRSPIDKPTANDPVVQAMIDGKAIGKALRALVTEFPQEWADFPAAVREDQDYCDSVLESCDRLELAIANIRALVTGGVSDEDLEKLLAGGGE